MFDTVEIDMPKRHDDVLVGLHDRKSRAGNLPGEAETVENATCKRRLAGAEIAEQSHHVSRAKAGAESRSECFSCFGGVEGNRRVAPRNGYRVHPCRGSRIVTVVPSPSWD